MRRRLAMVAALGAVCATLALGACAPPVTTRVLLIGNSYTDYNGGIGAALERLAQGVSTESITVGGATLQQHWDSGAAVAAIRRGGWDYVVLQEQSQTAVTDRAGFEQSVALLDEEARSAGATTVLLMTWERPDSAAAGVTTANLANAYTGVGSALGARVAPVGLAFATSLQQRPDLQLTQTDGHPTVLGTYLAACVLHDTLLHQRVSGNTYAPDGIDGGVRSYLHSVADRAAGF